MAVRAEPDTPLMGLRLPARTDYAIRAVLELAELPEGGSMKGREIASAQGIPRKYLMGILRQLTVGGLVRSRRGSDGGFRLSRPPSDITLAEVVAVVGPGGRAPVRDPDESTSPVALLWRRLQREVERVLSGMVLSDIVPPGPQTSAANSA